MWKGKGMAILGIPLGWIIHWLQEWIGNYGWTLIVFTVLVKLLMTPLTIKQQKSSAKMAAFQPKLKALESKYKNNKEKYQEEMMKLYEREGYSPTSGCLPMVVQMVILFGIIEVVYRPLRYVLQISKDTIQTACDALSLSSSQQLQIINIVQQGSGEKFDLIKDIFTQSDLSAIQNFNMNFLGLDLSQTPTLGWNWLIIIPILACASALLMSLVSMKQQKDSGQTQQNKMMMIMMFVSPLMSLVFAFQLPAGVGLYWIISNITSFLQTEIIRRIYTKEKLEELAATDKSVEKQREKMRKKRELMEKMTEGREYYLEKTGKNQEELEKIRKQRAGVAEDTKASADPSKSDKQTKSSASQTSQSRKKPASNPDDPSANDRIAAARKRLAELYGENSETETTAEEKKYAVRGRIER
jgi:YidC/Oxa1 family membrane protein insertase